MYELLSLDFFVAFEQGREYVEKDYYKWAPYFPITPQKKPFLIRKQLKKAFDQHVKAGFFAKEPEMIMPPGIKAYFLRFYPGSKAVEGYQRAIHRACRRNVRFITDNNFNPEKVTSFWG